MSWWVYLEDENGKPVPIERHTEGGTFVLGGTSDAELNVTYNYGALFRSVGVVMNDLSGKLASEITPLLEQAVQKLGTQKDEDYWKPTPGNAGAALDTILYWTYQHPKARLRVS